MSAIVKEAIRKLLITICMMWLFESRDKMQIHGVTDWMTYFIYPKDFDFQDERLKGKRIQIEFQIKDWEE